MNLSVATDNAEIRKSAFFKATRRLRCCCIKKCNEDREKTPNLRLFRFPLQQNLKIIWMENCKITSNVGIKSKFVCDKHFDKKCLGIKYLKPYAIPTIFSYAIKNMQPFLIENVPPKLYLKKCCVNECGLTNESERMFRFPSEKNVSDDWIKAFGFEASYEIKNKYVCGKHFANSLVLQKRLKKGALPTLNLGNRLSVFNFTEPETSNMEVNREPNFRSYPCPSSSYPLQEQLVLSDFLTLKSPPRKYLNSTVENDVFMCSRCETNIKTKSFYIKKQNFLSRKLRDANNKIYKLKKQMRSYADKFKNVEEVINKIDHANDNTKEFCKMLLKKSNTKYNEKQKNLAMNLNYKSNSCYIFMRDTLKFQLPSRSTIFNWTPIKKLQPGFNEQVIYNLKSQIINMDEKSKESILIFDEIKILKRAEYNKYLDLVDGLVDYGNNDRKCVMGSYICTFMVRGLYNNWKYVLSYVVSDDKSILGDKLKTIVLGNLNEAFKLELNIRAIVSDQGSNNRRCFSQLGITKEKPFFYHNSHKVYGLYDVPHLFKSIRNTFLKYDLCTPDGIISWSVLQKMYTWDSHNTVRMCPKIGQRHINPGNFDKMRVNLATQIMSKSVAAALKTCISLNLFKGIQLQKALSTQRFILKMDKTFDCLNSKK